MPGMYTNAEPERFTGKLRIPIHVGNRIFFARHSPRHGFVHSCQGTFPPAYGGAGPPVSAGQSPVLIHARGCPQTEHPEIRFADLMDPDKFKSVQKRGKPWNCFSFAIFSQPLNISI